ncbi:MAG: c-type cytochrome [Halothiobacillaceae bacterium]
MAQETPKVDPVSKLVTFIGVVLLLITVLYMVQSLLKTVEENTTRGPTVETPNVAEAEEVAAEAEAVAVAEEATTEAEAVEEAAAEETVAAAAAGDAAKGAEHFQANCASCHGMNAEGQGSFPKLAGMTAEEVDASLKAYRAGEKTGGQAAMMAPMAAGLSDEQIANLAAHIAEVGGHGAPAAGDDAAAESSAAEEEAAEATDAAAASGDVAAGQQKYQAQCASCHGMNGEGQGMFPKLAGQSAEQIVASLKAYKAGEKTGANAAMMAPMAAGLSDADMANLGAYISGL